ncbi:MAG: aminotransferase class I/II-fold pyridoxal phosphate-dependent enzyme [Myxococcota bacterium]|nr:aminotransferase class I/II-fold pyridoxal phosphate-dependent enzyme [Myxococcota bacterium]
MNLDTLAIHAAREQLGEAHVPPIDLSTTYKTPDLPAATASLDARAGGAQPVGPSIYQRLFNPTVDRFERALATLEGAEAGVSFSSGMAAMSAALLAAKLSGSHVVALRPIYGGTDHLLASGLLGLEVSWATLETLSDEIRADTSLVLCETPANPTLKLLDIEEVVERSHGVPVLVDSTFATPVLQQPLRHGAALVLHSGTKYLGGHGDVMAGVIACGEPWARRLRQVRILTGGNLHPMAAYTLHRGLQTLPLRVRAAQANAITLAGRLAVHPAVSRVYFPGLSGMDPDGLIGRQLAGPGAMISFELVRGYAAAATLISAVKLFTPAVSLGSTDSLIQHPAGLTHRIIGEAAQKESGIHPSLIRLSVGLEDVEDLWADLGEALARSLVGELPGAGHQESSA